MSRDRWQFELKIVRHIIPDLGAFEKALEGPFLILSNWYRLCSGRGTPRSSRGMVLAIIDEGRRTSVIILRLRVVNLRSGGRRRPDAERPSEVERSHGRRWVWLSSLCRLWFLVACVACVMIVIGVDGMVVVAADQSVLVPSFPCLFTHNWPYELLLLSCKRFFHELFLLYVPP